MSAAPASAPAPPQIPPPVSRVPPYNIPVYRLSDLPAPALAALTLRPKIDFTAAFATVEPIIRDVRARGDAAVLHYTATFDRAAPSPATLVVDPRTLPTPSLPDHIRKAFDVAYDNIRAFHTPQLRAGESNVTETMPGVRCARVARPIERAGIYVPGGTAVLPSTALMLAIPAQIAGCSEIILATPPAVGTPAAAGDPADPAWGICPEVLYCAQKCGVTKILKAGGAQAVAAMAYGTQTCPKVDKIAGPGNQFVTAAKMYLQNSGEAMVAIDMPAGPSEQLCIADESARVDFVVSDWLSQAEHGRDSQVVLIAVGKFNLPAFEAELHRQFDALPRRAFAAESLGKSLILLARDREEALRFSNLYAPEHLCIQTSDPEAYLAGVVNAGSVFMGHYAPESVGDYASGTNHSLPTYGYAKMYGGVSVDTFMKYITVQKLTPEGLLNVGPSVEIMAEVEGLHAHKNAVTIRLESIRRGERI